MGCCTVYIAEAAGFTLFRVMETARPVDRNVTFAAIQPCSTLHAASCTDAAKLEQAVKNWAVITHVEPALLFLVRLHIVGCHFLKELNVFICMKLGHLEIGSRFGTL